MLADYFSKVRQKCWVIIDKEYSEEKDKYSIAKELVTQSIKNGYVVLDAGCGHDTFLQDQVGLEVKKIGMDMVLEDVKYNKTIDCGLVSDINCIPFKSASFDLIICNMVFEHLQEPEKALAELNRIMKKNGYLIFMTPCIYNIVTIINRMIPNRFHKKIGYLLTGMKESDIFPTFYKANSVRTLRRLLEENDLIERDLIMYQPPPYAFVVSTILCKFVIFYYNIINKYDRLKFLRGVIIARYQKI